MTILYILFVNYSRSSSQSVMCMLESMLTACHSLCPAIVPRKGNGMFLAEDADWLHSHTSCNYTWNAVLLPERSELEWSTSSGDGGPRSDFQYSGQDATRRRWSCGDDRMFCMTKMTIVHGSFAVGCSMGFHRGTSARLDVQGSASTMQGGQWVVSE